MHSKGVKYDYEVINIYSQLNKHQLTFCPQNSVNY